LKKFRYVAYRQAGVNTMRVFKTKRLALKAARQVLAGDPHQNVEVGPMLDTRESALRGDQLRRVVARMNP